MWAKRKKNRLPEILYICALYQTNLLSKSEGCSILRSSTSRSHTKKPEINEKARKIKFLIKKSPALSTRYSYSIIIFLSLSVVEQHSKYLRVHSEASIYYFKFTPLSFNYYYYLGHSYQPLEGTLATTTTHHSAYYSSSSSRISEHHSPKPSITPGNL